MAEAFVQRCLQRVVCRVGNRVLCEDAAEHRNAVYWASGSGQGVALGRRIAPQAYEGNIVSECGVRRDHCRPVGSIWKMQPMRPCHRSCGKGKGTVREVRTTATGS